MKCNPRGSGSQVSIESIDRILARQEATILAAPSEQAVAVGDLDRLARTGPGVERIAWVGAPHVGCDRAPKAVAVRREIAEVVLLTELGAIAVGRQHERRAARPAADHLAGESYARLPARTAVLSPCRPVAELPEGAHVLTQLAQHQVAAVAAEVAQCG